MKETSSMTIIFKQEIPKAPKRKLQCKRCGYGTKEDGTIWVGRNPKHCSRCNSPSWNIERKVKKPLASELFYPFA